MLRLARALTLALAVIALIAAVSGTASNLGVRADRHFAGDLPVVRTESPQQTLTSLVTIKSEIEAARERYATSRGSADFALMLGLVDELISLIDLSTQPEAVARRNGVQTAMTLLEISDLIPPIDLAAVPDASAMRDAGFTSYAVPGTPLRLTRMGEGERDGEFLFDASTTRIAPRFLNGLQSDAPDAPVTDWTAEFEQFAGPWIPAEWIATLPPTMKRDLFGTPGWKVALTMSVALVIFLALFLARSALPSSKGMRLLPPISRLLYAASILPLLLFLRYVLEDQLNLTGRFADGVRVIFITIWYGSLAAIFWNAALAGAAAIGASKVERGDASDQSLLQLVAHVIGLVGAIWIAAYGLQSLGLPVFSLIAGLGIGGLAVALAIRPTLENLIGGLVIYLSKPVRVGDWCEFGTRSGTVERIGVRSTNIRAMDRTVISIPNAQFANMELVNWARCDQMLIEPTIGLIYNTTSDQLRYVLAEARRMALSHPRIDGDTVRIRFAGYGESSLDIAFRVYARTTEWNDFHAIREDFLLRLKDIVEAAGTSFAYPSRTLFVARNEPPDHDKTAEAENKVKTWRGRHELPFPNFSEKTRRKLKDTLTYPPQGSPDSDDDEAHIESASEPLSSEGGSPKETE